LAGLGGSAGIRHLAVFLFFAGNAFLHCMSVSLNEFLRYTRKGLLPAQFSLCLLGLGSYSYRARELLVCWLFFSGFLVVLAVAILSAVFAFYAGKYLIERMQAAAPDPPLPPPAAELAPIYHSPRHW
jgi:hypothetical protein